MNVIVNRESFSRILKKLYSVVPTRTPMPLLQCVHLKCEGRELNARATDGQLSLSMKMLDVDIAEPGEMTVRIAQLNEIASRSTSDTLKLAKANGMLEIVGSDCQFHVHTTEGELPESDLTDTSGFEIEASVLDLRLRSVLHAARPDSYRNYALGGVYLGSKAAAAMDRHMVAFRGAIGDAVFFGVIPSRTAKMMPGLFDGPINVTHNPYTASFTTPTVRLITPLVDGEQYPLVKKIPTDCKVKSEIDSQSLVSALHRASVMTNELSHGAVVKLFEDHIQLQSSAKEVGDADIRCPASTNGSGMSFKASVRDMIEAIKASGGDFISLGFGGERMPVTFKYQDYIGAVEVIAS